MTPSEYPLLESLFDTAGTFLIPIIVIVVFLIVKDWIFGFFKGLAFKFDRDFNEDSEIFLDGRRATIVSIGILETRIRYIDRNGITTVRKVENSKIKSMCLEKITWEDSNGNSR